MSALSLVADPYTGYVTLDSGAALFVYFGVELVSHVVLYENVGKSYLF